MLPDRRWAPVALAYLLGLAGLLGGHAAFGHAVLLSSDPAAEAELDVAPREIRLGFNENVGPIFVKVLDSRGAEVGDPGDFRVSGNDVFLPLGAELADGTYVAVYRVISADTHPVGGSVMFAVGEPLSDVGSVADAGAAVSGWQLPVAVNRLALYVGGTLAAGSALLLLLLPIASWPSSAVSPCRSPSASAARRWSRAARLPCLRWTPGKPDSARRSAGAL
jgi:copper transport protein